MKRGSRGIGGLAIQQANGLEISRGTACELVERTKVLVLSPDSGTVKVGKMVYVKDCAKVNSTLENGEPPLTL